jgi:hypothetical protein
MTTAELLEALTLECPNGVSFDLMAVRLLRQKVPFEDWQIEDLKAVMFQLGNGLWFCSEMISDVECRLAFNGQAMEWLKEYGCFSVERLFGDFCGVFRQIATPEDCAAFLRHLGFMVAVWGKGGYFCSLPPNFSDRTGACDAITEHRKVKPVTPAAKTAGKAGGAAPARSREGAKLLLAFADSGAGKIEALLMRPEGASLEEMRVHRGAVESHLNSLKKAGFNIVRHNGRYYYVETGDLIPGAALAQKEQANELPLRLDDSLAAISETIAGWLEEAGGTLTFHEIEQAMPHLTTEALEDIRAQFLPEVHETEVGGVPCWCSTEAIHLPEDFSEKLTTVVDTLVALDEKVSAAKLEFALNLFYRIRFREEYALLDNDTFMRACAKHYQGGNNVFPNTKRPCVRVNHLSVPGRRMRSPNTRFRTIDVPVGAELVFTRAPQIACVVLDESNQVEYEGKAWSISALAIHLLGVSSANGFCHFSYEGEILWDRRLRLEQADKQDEYQAEQMPTPAEIQEAACKIIGLEGRPLSPSTWRGFRSDGTNSRVAVWARRVENGESVEQIARESGYAVSTMKVMISNFHLYFKVCRLNGIVPDGDADV